MEQFNGENQKLEKPNGQEQGQERTQGQEVHYSENERMYLTMIKNIIMSGEVRIQDEMKRTNQKWIDCVGSIMGPISSALQMLEMQASDNLIPLENLHEEFDEPLEYYKSVKDRVRIEGGEATEEEKAEIMSGLSAFYELLPVFQN